MYEHRCLQLCRIPHRGTYTAPQISYLDFRKTFCGEKRGEAQMSRKRKEKGTEGLERLNLHDTWLRPTPIIQGVFTFMKCVKWLRTKA